MLIVIRWFDSALSQATYVYTKEDAEAHSLIILETVGWLVKETDAPFGGHFIIAASKHGEEGAWRGVQSIPKANVIWNRKMHNKEEEDA